MLPLKWGSEILGEESSGLNNLACPNGGPTHAGSKCFVCSKRESRRQYQEARRNSLQQWAQNKLNVAIRNGQVMKACAFRCKDCGKPAQVWDHRDYNKPLEVEAVCRGCNARRGPALGADLYLLPLRL